MTSAYALWAVWSTSLQPFPGSWHLVKAQYASIGGENMTEIWGAAYVLYNSVLIAIVTGAVVTGFLLNFVRWEQLTEWQCATLKERITGRIWNWWEVDDS